MTPSEHDRLLAKTSHLPHLAAAMLVELAFGGEDAGGVRDACGAGFRDATRMAAGSEDVWHDIVRTNAGALAEEMDKLAGIASRLRADIAAGRFDRIREFLGRCRAIRADLYRSGNSKSAALEDGADG